MKKIILIVLTLLMFYNSYSEEKIVLGIIDLTPLDVKKEIALSISELLRTKINKTGKFLLVEKDKITEVLQKEKLQQSEINENNAVEIGKLLNCNKLLIGSLNKVDKGYIINIKVIDIETGYIDIDKKQKVKSKKKIPATVKALSKEISVSLKLEKLELVKNKILILNFENTSANENLSYLEKSIPSSIITVLLKTDKFIVIENSKWQQETESLGFSMKNLKKTENALKVARLLKADALVIGSFLNIDKRIKINARIINVKTGNSVSGADAIGNTGRDVFELIDTISEKLSTDLQKAFGPEKQRIIEKIIEKEVEVEKIVEVEKPVKTVRERKDKKFITANNFQEKIMLTINKDKTKAHSLFKKKKGNKLSYLYKRRIIVGSIFTGISLIPASISVLSYFWTDLWLNPAHDGTINITKGSIFLSSSIGFGLGAVFFLSFGIIKIIRATVCNYYFKKSSISFNIASKNWEYFSLSYRFGSL